MKKIFIGIGAVVLLALAGRAVWAYYQVIAEKNVVAQLPVAHDIAPIDDSDLRLEKVVVADSENAYFDLIKIDKVIHWPKEKSQTIYDMVAGKTWDAQLAQELVSKNTEAFKYFTDASLKQKYQDPVSADPINISPDTTPPPMNNWRNMAYLSAVKSITFEKQGKDKEAMVEAMRSLDIGQKMQDSQGNFIEYLVATAMKNIGLQTTQKILVSSKFKASELKKYVQDLNHFYKNKDGLVASLKAEYTMLLLSLEGITKGVIPEGVQSVAEKINDPYYYQPNKTKELFARNTRLMIQNTYGQCAEIKPIEKQEISTVKAIVTENAIGVILSNVSASSLWQISNKRCQQDSFIGATQTMFAIKAFKNDTKKYPTMLDELVPKYLGVVPTDPFDGKQIKYSSEKKIVYSVGEDKQDDGGIMSDDGKKTPDIVYSIGF